MIKYIWGLFIIIGVCYGFISGNMVEVNDSIINYTGDSIKMIIKIVPLMGLWMGIMRIASDSGLLKIVSKKMGGIVRIIFPDIPKDHEVISLISSNMTMNMLGLGNAATPFGLEAMKGLQELNDDKERASRSMITFLVINTASITIIPTTIISIRLMYNSSNPNWVIGPSIVTSFLSLGIGLMIDRVIYNIIRRKR